MRERRHIVTTSLDIRLNQLATVKSCRSRSRRKPVISAPLIFNKLGKPRKIFVSRENHMVRNTNGEKSTFWHSHNRNRQITKFMQFFKLGKICIIRVEGILNYMIPLLFKKLNGLVKKLRLPKHKKFLNSILMTKDYGLRTIWMMFIATSRPSGINH